VEFSITEELAVSMPVKGTITGADLYEVQKMPQKLSALMADGAPSMVGRNSGVSSLIVHDVKDKMNRDLIVCNCLITKKICVLNPSD